MRTETRGRAKAGILRLTGKNKVQRLADHMVRGPQTIILVRVGYGLLYGLLLLLLLQLILDTNMARMEG